MFRGFIAWDSGVYPRRLRATPPPPVALEEVKVEEVGACEVNIEEFGLKG